MWNLMMSLFSLVFHRCKEEKIKVQIKLFFMVYRLRFQYGKNLSSVRLIFIQTLWGPPCRWCLKGASKATLDFKKRCVSESSPHTCMCLYVRRSKSSIPSTFSDILDKSFLNEQTSLCSEERGKTWPRRRKNGNFFMLNFHCWESTYCIQCNEVKVESQIRFCAEKIPAGFYVHAVNCKNLDWHEFLSLLGGKGMLEQQPQISLVIHWHVLASTATHLCQNKSLGCHCADWILSSPLGD